jgi:hypothetical protein
MENHGLKRIVVHLLLSGIFVITPFFVSAYDNDTTHPALTRKSIELFDHYYSTSTLNSKEANYVVNGSINEDDAPRWLNHFYDPVYERGFTFDNLSWPSSKLWAGSARLQGGPTEFLAAGVTRGYFTADDDYSWERAIYEYAWGDKRRGLESLGHILHLIQDATVPEHTRNDPHPPIADLGSPYEEWTKIVPPIALKNLKPIIYENLADYFNSVARYSNSKFYSEHTIGSTLYFEPVGNFVKTETLSDGKQYLFEHRLEDGQDYHLDMISVAKTWGSENEKTVRDIDHLVLSDYWRLLSRQAVANGAGIIKLFFDDVAKEKETKVLYKKNKSWLSKLLSSLFHWTVIAPKEVREKKQLADQPEQEPVIVPTKDQTANIISVFKTPLPAPIVPTTTIASSTATTTATDTAPTAPTSSPPANPMPISEPGYGGGMPSFSAPAPAPSMPEPAEEDYPRYVELTIQECVDAPDPVTCDISSDELHISWNSTSTSVAYYELDGIFGSATTTETSSTVEIETDSEGTVIVRACNALGVCSPSAEQYVHDVIGNGIYPV